MQSKTILATGQYDLTSASPSYISCVAFTVYGFTGSMVPQIKMDVGGVPGITPNYFNCTYTNQATGVSYAAGTALTADGMYLADTSGAQLSLNVTDAGDGNFQVNYWPLEGPAPAGSSGGGGGGAVTVADGADVALGTTTDAAVGDATGTLIAHARMSAKAAAQGAADNSTVSTFKAPVLVATANAAAPSWTEGRQVPASVTLTGDQRVQAKVVSGGIASGAIASGAVASGAIASGAVASGAVAAGALAAGAGVDGWDLTQGAKGDAAVTNPATSGSVVAFLKGLLTQLQAGLSASAAYIGHVGGTSPSTGVEITRPADTTAYAANDSVNTSTSAPTTIVFTGASRIASGTGRILKAQLVTDQAACVAQFRLWLFNSSAPFLNNDNAAFLIKYADNAVRLGYIDFPALATEAGSDCAVAAVGFVGSSFLMHFTADASSQIYGVLETKTAFTPANAQKFFVKLSFDQD